MVLDSKVCKKLILFELFFWLFINIFIETLHVPSAIVFITDGINIVLLIYMALFRKKTLKVINTRWVHYILWTIVLYSLFSGLINAVNPIHVLWGGRKFFRGFIFFVACIRFLDVEDIERVFDKLFFVQLINVGISIYQFIVLGLKQDHLGGIFGQTAGANAWSNLFFCILLTYYISKFLIEKNRQYKYKFVVILSSTIILAALAEIKFFFVEFVIIIILTMLFAKKSFKTVLMSVFGIIALYVGMYFFSMYFPDFYSRFNSIESIIGIGKDVGTGYNIGRLSAFSTIKELFFNNNIFRNLFGLGLGSCEMGSIGILVSPFYQKYGVYNYIWFGHMITFLELGYIGVILVIAFFVLSFVYSFRNMKNNSKNVHASYHVFTMVMDIISILNFWYNNFIRGEIQFLIYFALSVGLISIKDKLNSI